MISILTGGAHVSHGINRKLTSAMSSSVTLDENGAGWFPVPTEGFGPAPGEFY